MKERGRWGLKLKDGVGPRCHLWLKPKYFCYLIHQSHQVCVGWNQQFCFLNHHFCEFNDHFSWCFGWLCSARWYLGYLDHHATMLWVMTEKMFFLRPVFPSMVPRYPWHFVSRNTVWYFVYGIIQFSGVRKKKTTVAGIPKENLLGNHPGVWLLMQSCRVFGDLGEATWTFCEFVGGF